MATIKMDVSEYEALKETQELLKESLKKEEALKEEIQRVRDEKIEALEAAQKKVIKTIRVIRQENITVRKPAYEITEAFKRLIKQTDGFVGSYDVGTLINACFKTTIVETDPVQEDTSYQGFTETKIELRNQIRDEIEDEVKEKIEKFDDFSIENYNLKNNVDTLQHRINALEGQKQELENSLELAHRKFKKIEEIINKQYYFWSATGGIQQIRKLFN